jgi:phosphoketolase
MPDCKKSNKQLKEIEKWLKTYKIEELLDKN